jgi:hypothetical protein
VTYRLIIHIFFGCSDSSFYYVMLYVCSFRHGTTEITCSYHPDALLIEDYRAGDQICSECGLVVGDRLVKLGVVKHRHST